MATLPVISVKSKALQADLGVRSVRGARDKLIRDFGVTIIENEYVSVKELEQKVELKLSDLLTTGSSSKSDSYLEGSSFQDMED